MNSNWNNTIKPLFRIHCLGCGIKCPAIHEIPTPLCPTCSTDLNMLEYLQQYENTTRPITFGDMRMLNTWIKYRTMWESGSSEYKRIHMVGNPTNGQIVDYIQKRVENLHLMSGYSHFEWERVKGDEKTLLQEVSKLERRMASDKDLLNNLYIQLAKMK